MKKPIRLFLILVNLKALKAFRLGIRRLSADPTVPYINCPIRKEMPSDIPGAPSFPKFQTVTPN